MNPISPAELVLDASGTPYAPAFEDCYFSRLNGLAESRYVFLQGNQLPERWRQREQFVIAETGFGTGLNFLATWQAWREDPARCERLHFISIEKHPIVHEQLTVLLAMWGELAPLAEQLLAVYPPAVSGFHTLYFDDQCVRLTLCFEDVQTALRALMLKVDAWYLDGFAPSRNPEMWRLPVLQEMTRLSHADTTLATFTAAGEVRRNLQQVGFQVEKRAGFGKKREMLTARLGLSESASVVKPWFQPPVVAGSNRTVTVIGGGIAGCQVAYALAVRGWQVHLIERHSRLASEASGNRAGVLTAKMTAEAGLGELFYRQAFLFAVRQLQALDPIKPLTWAQCGALQLAHDAREQKRQGVLRERQFPSAFLQVLDAVAASDVAGIPLPMGGCFFPQGGWVNPASVCAALTQHPLIQLHLHTEALHLQRVHGEWHVLNQDNVCLQHSAALVIANGKDANQFEQTQYLPFVPVAGQTTQASASEYSQQLKVTLGHEGYLVPAWQGVHVFGATFERNTTQPTLTDAANVTNAQQLHAYLPELHASLGVMQSSHAAVRMTTPDRYPMAGAVPDMDFFNTYYADLKHGKKYQQYPSAQYLEGLYLLAGLGSRGLTTSAYCADMLAMLMNNEPLGIQNTLYEALHPARFLVRALKRA